VGYQFSSTGTAPYPAAQPAGREVVTVQQGVAEAPGDQDTDDGPCPQDDQQGAGQALADAKPVPQEHHREGCNPE